MDYLWIIYDIVDDHPMTSTGPTGSGCRTFLGTSGSPVGGQVLVVAPRKRAALDHALPDGLVKHVGLETQKI